MELQSLLRGSQQGQADNLYLDIEVEESVDAFNDVLLTTWQPTGLGRFFMAPRCLRMRRLWRWGPPVPTIPSPFPPSPVHLCASFTRRPSLLGLP